MKIKIFAAIIISSTLAFVSVSKAQEIKAPVNDKLNIMTILSYIDRNVLNDNNKLWATAYGAYCNDMVKLKNDFDRMDFVRKLRTEIESRLKTFDGTIHNIEGNFDISRYDFRNQSFSVIYGRYDWTKNAPLGFIRNEDNINCWKLKEYVGVTGTHYDIIPTHMTAVPEWEKISSVIKVQEDEARRWYIGGDPTASLTFSMKAEATTPGQYGTQRIIIKGRTLSWSLTISNGAGEVVKTLQGSLLHAPAKDGVLPTSTNPERLGIAPGRRRITSELNVRSIPSVRGDILSKLQPDNEIAVIETSQDGYWSRVARGDRPIGWIRNSALSKASNPSSAP